MATLFSALCHQYLNLIFIDAHHGFAKVLAQFCYDFRIVIVGNSLHNGICIPGNG